MKLEQMMKEMVAQGKVIEMAKYRAFGSYGAWKPVSLEVALRKSHVLVWYDDEFGDRDCACPYTFRFVEG